MIISIYRVKWLVFCMIVIAISSCNLLSGESLVTSQEKWYSIDPSTVLELIRLGKKDVFTLLYPPPELFFELEPSSWNSVWNQNDYMFVANALHKVGWNEGLESWGLYQINFGLRCDKVGVGFYNAQFGYYQIDSIGGRKSRIVHLLTIDPGVNTTSIFERVYSPTVRNWPTIDLEKVKISAEEAVRIAEINGGYEMRSSVNNVCNISIILAPGSASYHGWRIVYEKDRPEMKRLLDFDVDPYTGEIK